MKKMLLSLIAALLLTAAFNAFCQEQATAPVYQEGDFWQFKIIEKGSIATSQAALAGTYELSYSNGTVQIAELQSGEKSEELESKRRELLTLLGQSKILQDLKFPLSVGQKWSYQYMGGIRGVRFSRSVQVDVTGIEEVSTAAGTFRAFKIEKYDTGGTGGKVSRQVTIYFYSPRTKSVVKSLYESLVSGSQREIELIKFGSAR